MSQSHASVSGKFVTSVVDLVSSSRATEVGSKNFSPIELEGQGEFSVELLLDPLTRLLHFLETFQFQGGYPFTLAAGSLSRLLRNAPQTPEEYKAAEKWLAEVNELLDLIDADAKGKAWGRLTAFSSARAEISAFKAAVEKATTWSSEDDIVANTMVQIVIGTEYEVNAYVRSFGDEVASQRADGPDELDGSAYDPKDPLSELLETMVGMSGMRISIQPVVISGLGDLRQLPTVDFRETSEAAVEEPNLEQLFDAVNKIGKALRNIPGGVLREATELHARIFRAISSAGPEALRNESLQRQLIQLAKDLEAELKEADVRIPGSCKPALEAAIGSVKSEVPKLKNLEVSPDCVIRVIVCPVIGVKRQVQTTIASISEVLEAKAPDALSNSNQRRLTGDTQSNNHRELVGSGSEN